MSWWSGPLPTCPRCDAVLDVIDPHLQRCGHNPSLVSPPKFDPEAVSQGTENVPAEYCMLCFKPFRLDGVLKLRCDHMFDFMCLRDACGGGTKWKCPIDGKPVKIRDSQTLRSPSADLETYCIYMESGCKWTGPLNRLGVHLFKCDHAVFGCSNPRVCGFRGSNRETAAHLSGCYLQYLRVPDRMGVKGSLFLLIGWVFVVAYLWVTYMSTP